jgi:hypothetical protein
MEAEAHWEDQDTRKDGAQEDSEEVMAQEDSEAVIAQEDSEAVMAQVVSVEDMEAGPQVIVNYL